MTKSKGSEGNKLMIIAPFVGAQETKQPPTGSGQAEWEAKGGAVA